MESKAFYLRCASGPLPIFYLLNVFALGGMTILWAILFFWLIAVLIKERKEIKNVLAKHKARIIALIVLLVNIVGFILITNFISRYNYFSDDQNFYSLVPIFWSLGLLIFFGKALISGLLRKKIFSISMLGLIFILLGFSSFVLIQQFNEFNLEKDAYEQEAVAQVNQCIEENKKPVKDNIFGAFCAPLNDCVSANKCSLEDVSCQNSCDKAIQQLVEMSNTSLGCGGGFKLY